MRPKHIFILIVLVIGVIIFSNSAFVVKESQQVMVLSLGKIDRVVTDAGLHFKSPFYQQIRIFDKRILETDSPSEELQAGDKKRLVIDSFTRWRIFNVRKFYESVRSEYYAKQRLNVIVNSTIRKVLAKVPLNVLISEKREGVMNEILAESRNEAKELGIDRAYGGLLPEDKFKEVERLRADGKIVAFVGDGINDAPVITLADVGFAMGGLGSDAAIETADVGVAILAIANSARIGRMKF